MSDRFLGFEIKSVSGEGEFEGLLASYGGVDLVNDTIVPGAFTKTLNDHNGEFPLLWQHRSEEPVGTIRVKDSPVGLKAYGRLVLEVGKAREAYALLKSRAVRALSIGYRVVKSDIAQNGVRMLREIALLEGSIVTFGADPRALVEAVKSEQQAREAEQAAQRKAEYDEFIRQVKEKMRW